MDPKLQEDQMGQHNLILDLLAQQAQLYLALYLVDLKVHMDPSIHHSIFL
jgi:hypothetical protein